MTKNIKYVKIKDGDFGLLNLSNMIPVPDNVIINFDIRSSANKNIYFQQLRYLKKHLKEIEKDAKKIYELFDKGDKDLIKHCCNYKLLEDKQKEYKR